MARNVRLAITLALSILGLGMANTANAQNFGSIVSSAVGAANSSATSVLNGGSAVTIQSGTINLGGSGTATFSSTLNGNTISNTFQGPGTFNSSISRSMGEQR